MRLTEFEPAIPASKRPQAHDTDQAAIGIGTMHAILYETPTVALMIINKEMKQIQRSIR